MQWDCLHYEIYDDCLNCQTMCWRTLGLAEEPKRWQPKILSEKKEKETEGKG